METTMFGWYTQQKKGCQHILTQNIASLAHTQPPALNTWSYSTNPSQNLIYSPQQAPYMFLNVFSQHEKYIKSGVRLEKQLQWHSSKPVLNQSP